MIVVTYLIFSIIWIGCFYAFMDNKKQEKISNAFWKCVVEYDSKWDNNTRINITNYTYFWEGRYVTLFIIGIPFWWATILFILIYKLTNKYFFSK